jgi:hypothetical protein
MWVVLIRQQRRLTALAPLQTGHATVTEHHGVTSVVPQCGCSKPVGAGPLA